ncbi:MAG: uracil-DNA glycosylase family protein [Gammaproteobacteria bacterium]|nr:uracil-DNA glycosylase family protein [Gammaproteobacteria bacterium]
MSETNIQLIKKLENVSACQLCANKLPLPPNPIVQIHSQAQILIIGQAPGLQTHQRNLPFKDQSGDRLRDWLGVNEQQFYNPELFAIMPMAFCYPGKAKSGSGDAPPPKICQQTWHNTLRTNMTNIKLTILIGSYAAKAYVENYHSLNVAIIQSDITNTVVLPHPSPRNNIWLKKNDWFETKTLPKVRQRLSEILDV